MASNDWINSYLEAILDVGPGLVDDAKSSLLLRERGHFSPTRYFVEEVITGFDETDLHRSWVRVSLTLTLSVLILFLLYSQFDSLFMLIVHAVCMGFNDRLRRRGAPRRGTPDWRICAGGFGT